MDKEQLNKVLRFGWIALILLVVFLGVETLAQLKTLSKVEPANNTISVTGQGESVTVPDIATFSFSVSADGKTVADAQKQVTNKMNDALTALKNLGIADKDIKTTNYSVYPKYSYTASVCGANMPCYPGKQVLEGYTASHDISVKIREASKVGDALAAVGDKGATNISNVTFTMDDPNAPLNEARTAAIADARAKAHVLAKALGVDLVRVVSYYDNTTPTPVVYGMGTGAADKAMSSVAPVLPSGENKVTLNVTVVYEIR